MGAILTSSGGRGLRIGERPPPTPLCVGWTAESTGSGRPHRADDGCQAIPADGVSVGGRTRPRRAATLPAPLRDWMTLGVALQADLKS